MSRIFWDTMMLIYVLEGHPQHQPRMEALLESAYQRNDRLYSSLLALGEVMAGTKKTQNAEGSAVIHATLTEMGFEFLPFDAGAVEPFSDLRAKHKLRAPDAIHLACAASAGIDLFLTGDKQLVTLFVPGIQFIADFYTPLL
jgi:predicted nucleic acid-binding protein